MARLMRFAVIASSTLILPSMVQSGSSDAHTRAAIDGQRHAGYEIGLVRRQEEGGVGDVPGSPHAPAQRHPGVAFGGGLGATAVAGAGARIAWRARSASRRR